MNWFNNTRPGTGVGTGVGSETERELVRQTEILRKEYGDRVSGYRQNYQKWD